MAMNFKEGRWNHEINVTDFVKTNITPYEGDASFLTGPTERTKAVWNKCRKLLQKNVPTTVYAHLTPQPFQPLLLSLREYRQGKRSDCRFANR